MFCCLYFCFALSTAVNKIAPAMNFGRATFCIHTLYRLTINSDENFAIALMCFWCVQLCGCLHRQAHIYCSVSPAFFAFRCARSFPFHSVAFTTQLAISYIYILLSLIVHKSHTKTSHVQWTLLTFDEWEKERESFVFIVFRSSVISWQPTNNEIWRRIRNEKCK